MPGLGTLINVAAIIIGGTCGRLFGSRLTARIQETLLSANGICVLFIGISGVVQKMFVIGENGKIETVGTMMLIASFCIGALVGELLDLESRIEHFGEWLKLKTGNEKDGSFVNAFVTASLTVCIGAMAVVGAIQDGILGDYSILTAKAVLDLIIVMVMAASMGKGCTFSAIPVGIFQGTVTILARLLEPLMTAAALDNLSLTGSAMIFCVGLNLVWGKKIRVANLLPGLIVAVLWR